jgi:FkbM family methyltransferase
MGSGFLGKAKQFPIRAARSAAARTGNEQRMEELEAVFRAGARRALRDDLVTDGLLAAVLRTDSCAIDVGANVGDVLEKIVRIAPQGSHIAYEPVPHLAQDLVRRFPQVDVRRAALSEEPGESTFTHVVSDPAFSGLIRRDDLPESQTEEIKVEVQKLDDALPKGFRPALIKIDVEGAEVLVLKGARETLAKHKPVLLFEHGLHGADLYGSTSAELWDIVDESGLRIFDLDGNGPFSRDEFAALFTEPVWNYLAVPK